MNRAPLGVKVSDVKSHFEIRLSQARVIMQALVDQGKVIVFKVHNCTYYTPKEKYKSTQDAVSAQRAAQEGTPKSPEEYKARIMGHLKTWGDVKLKDLRNGVRIRRVYLNTFLAELVQEEKIVMNRRSDGIFVSLKPVKVEKTIPEMLDRVEQAYLLGTLPPAGLTEEEHLHLEQLKMILDRFKAFHKDTKFNISRNLKLTMEECTHHLDALVRYGLLQETTLGELKLYKRVDQQPALQSPVIDEQKYHPWRMYPPKKAVEATSQTQVAEVSLPMPQVTEALPMPQVAEALPIPMPQVAEMPLQSHTQAKAPQRRQGGRQWLAASLVLLLATACGVPTAPKATTPPAPSPVDGDPFAGERMMGLSFAQVQSMSLNSCEAHTQMVPGPVWRQAIKVDDSAGYTNYLQMKADLPVLAGLALSSYTDESGQARMPQVRLMLSDHLKPVQVVDPVSGKAHELQGRFNAGLMYDAQTASYWAFVEYGNYREKDASGNASDFVVQRQLTRNGKAIRFPAGQSVNIEHAFSTSKIEMRELEVDGEWLKLPVPVATSHLKVQASRYYEYTVTNGQLSNGVLVQNGPPVTLSTPVPMVNTLLGGEHQVGFTRALWYPSVKGAKPGTDLFQQFLAGRNDMQVGFAVTGSVGRASVDSAGNTSSTTLYPAGSWNLGSPSKTNAQNCLGAYTYVEGNKHDVVTPQVGPLPADPLPVVGSVKVEPYTSLQLLVNKSSQLTASATHPSGRPIPAPPVWTTSNSSVAQVSGGLVTGVRAGTATVYAKLGSRYRAVTVNVKAGMVEAERIPLSASGQRSYIIKNDGLLYGFGSGLFLGLGATYSGSSITSPTRINPIVDALAVESNDFNTFVVTSDGSVWGWGDNQFGQLGNGNQVPSHTPVKVPISDVVKVKTCMSNTFALKADGSVWVWGDNSQQQIAKTSQMVYVNPIPLSGMTDVKKLACFAFVKSNNTMWGLDPATANYIQSATNIADVSSHMSVFALKTDGSVIGGGFNYDPQLVNGTAGWLGVGTKVPQYDTPIPIPALKGIRKITTQNGSTFAFTSGGQVMVFGNNHAGQLGVNSTTDLGLPVQLSTPTAFNHISPGSYHTLAVDGTGKLWAWGAGGSGQLGTGATSSLQLKPKLTSISGVMLP